MEAASAPISTRAVIRSVASSPRLSEPVRVVCWRLAQLSEAGYSDEATAALATLPEVDLHRATDLLLHGCPHETALRILL
jgi:hypothetical protein